MTQTTEARSLNKPRNIVGKRIIVRYAASWMHEEAKAQSHAHT